MSFWGVLAAVGILCASTGTHVAFWGRFYAGGLLLLAGGVCAGLSYLHLHAISPGSPSIAASTFMALVSIGLVVIGVFLVRVSRHASIT